MNIQDPHPLAEAAFCGDMELVRSLIAAGADINAMGRVWNPLHAAIENQEAEVVQLLLRAGADPDYVINWFTPLLHAIDVEADAAHQGNLPEPPQPILVKILVEGGADFKRRVGGQTPLQMALDRGHEEAANYLREQGAV